MKLYNVAVYTFPQTFMVAANSEAEAKSKAEQRLREAGIFTPVLKTQAKELATLDD